MQVVLISSPLQGYTDYRFRNAFQKHFGGIDMYYAPYIRLNGNQEIKASYQRDLAPENNPDIAVQPQVMCKSAEDFLLVADYVQSLGYSELNWNLGCPYPMVTKKGLGAGLLKDADRIVEILDEVFEKSSIELSLKMRLGDESADEIKALLPKLDKFPIKNIAIHPRLGKQQYKGEVDLAAFEECLSLSKHQIIYNGDIASVEKYNELKQRFPQINTWMLGRGIIQDPFLPQMIKQNQTAYPDNAIQIFRSFHDELLEEYSQALSGDKHIILKMYHFWEYFSDLFTNSRKCLKWVKKAQSLAKYEMAVLDIFRSEEIVGINVETPNLGV